MPAWNPGSAIATDRDPAGDKAAADWPTVARRVRPPGPLKDWTEAQSGGVDLSRWWREVLAGNDRPPLFTRDDLSRSRWGESRDDPTPGIVIDRPEPPSR